jgi:hypothetical protein
MLFQQLPIDLYRDLQKQLKNYCARRQDFLELPLGNPTVQGILTGPCIGGDEAKIGFPLEVLTNLGYLRRLPNPGCPRD